MRWPRRDRPRDRSRTGEARVPHPENGYFRDHRRRWRPAQVNPSETSPGTACRNAGTGTVSGTIGTVTREVVETVRESLVIGSL